MMQGRCLPRPNALSRLCRWEQAMPIRYTELVNRVTPELPPLPWVESNGVPWTPITKPLAASRVMMVASAGVHDKREPPFKSPNDLTFRLIASDADAASLT